MVRLLLLVLLLVPCLSFALTHEVYEVLEGESRTLFVVYDEGGQCFLDEYRMAPGKLQERVLETQFSECNSARAIAIERGGKPQATRAHTEPKFVTETNTAIWEATEKWNDEWEKKYSDWIASNVSYRFHFDNGVATDCADVAISSRWIFARIHHLPMGTTLAGSGALFTNESMLRAWKDLPTNEDWRLDERFRAALDYILDNSYTHSLIEDSYPVSIEPGVFGPGVHHLNLYSQQTGHTQLMIDLNNYVGISLVASTVPRDVRQLFQASFYEPQYYSIQRGGFLKIRWTEKVGDTWRMVPAREMPHYSMMQYDSRFMNSQDRSFHAAILRHLGVQLDPLAALTARFDELDILLAARIQIVKDGYAYCKEHDCSPGTEGFENWGTPNRDQRLGALIYTLFEIYSSDGSAEMDRLWESRAYNELEPVPGYQYSISYIMTLFSSREPSFDPRDSMERRWGIGD